MDAKRSLKLLAAIGAAFILISGSLIGCSSTSAKQESAKECPHKKECEGNKDECEKHKDCPKKEECEKRKDCPKKEECDASKGENASPESCTCENCPHAGKEGHVCGTDECKGAGCCCDKTAEAADSDKDDAKESADEKSDDAEAAEEKAE